MRERVLACTLVVLGWVAPSPAADGANSSAKAGDADTVTLRIRFGYKDKDQTDWSGTITPSSGKVQSIRGWRWMPGDHADGNSFTVSTRRGAAMGAAERKRAAAGNKMPMTDNGIIVTLSGTGADDQITFDAKPGKAMVKLSDLPLGKKKIELDGNLAFERVPVATNVVDTTEEEDYPATAMAKDGTVYLAYLSFKHGKDFEGPRERPETSESAPVHGALAVGEVKKLDKPEDFDYLAEPTGGEQVFLRVRNPDGTWNDPVAVTDRSMEYYRPAVAIDGDGKVWVFYPAHVDGGKNLDQGDWELMARRFDAGGTNPAVPVNVSSIPGTDFMPAATADAEGKVWVTWVGARDAGYSIFVSHQDGAEKFTAPQRVTQSKANEWEPAIAADAKGNLTIAWDTYEKGDYDVYLSRRSKDGSFESPQAVAATLNFEVRPTLAYDAQSQLWIVWEESGDQWGKDFGGLKKKGIPIYEPGRSIAARVLREDGQWFEPPDVMDSVPAPNPTYGGGKRPRGVGKSGGGGNQRPTGVSGTVAPCFPRLASDAAGNVWLAYRGRGAAAARSAVGSTWYEYVTRVAGDEWAEAAWVPRSNAGLDNRPAVLSRDGTLTMLFAGDGRGEMNPPKVARGDAGEKEANAEAAAVIPPTGSFDDGADASPDALAKTVADVTAAPDAASAPKGDGKGRGGAKRDRGDVNLDLFTTSIRASDLGSTGEPKLASTQPAKPATPIDDVTVERNSIDAIHDYRVHLNGQDLRIWRGEFHRHTEYSFDGVNDGALLDMWRYAIDAADLDWIGNGDHDYGSGREYTWWTTQKAVTLFTRPGHFTPMFCYERSVSYPEGHRNCMFAQRGVRSLPRLPISSPDKFAPAPDTDMLYVYLKRFNAITAPHTSATDMGTDWRNYGGEELEPFVEIYQGDRNSYERPDAPRTAVTEAKLKQSTPEKESMGGWRPKGFVSLALKMGRRYGFECSSDHISTHLAYCNVLVKEPTREAILEAIKKRRVYASTANIIADVRCKDGDAEHWMGEEFTASAAPTLNVHIIGARKIVKVTIVKDDEEVHVVEPDKQDVSFTWTDPNPTPGKTSYYYVRGEQEKDFEATSSGELVWASPMWIKYEPKK